MFGKIAGLVLSVAKWSLLTIGALVVALVWWLSSGEGKKPAKEVESVQSAAVPVESCECSAGAVCSGPRGGRYCLRPDGSKKRLVQGD